MRKKYWPQHAYGPFGLIEPPALPSLPDAPQGAASSDIKEIPGEVVKAVADNTIKAIVPYIIVGGLVTASLVGLGLYFALRKA